MLPATSTGDPAASRIAPSSAVVVVFPFVPVTPSSGFGSSRAPSSISEITGMPRARARCDRGGVSGHTRALDDEPDAVEQRVVPVAEAHLGLETGRRRAPGSWS